MMPCKDCNLIVDAVHLVWVSPDCSQNIAWFGLSSVLTMNGSSYSALGASVQWKVEYLSVDTWVLTKTTCHEPVTGFLIKNKK